MTKAVIHNVDGVSRSFVIRSSTDDDVRKIYEWLKEEDKHEVHGNFLCNWNLTARCHEDGKLLVLVDEIEGIPVAYQWGRLLQSGILQVRHEWRGKGLGRVLVEHCVELALEQDEMVLQIECKPTSSIQFWRAMGFTIVEGEDGDNAKGYRVLSKKLVLPACGMPASVQVSSFPEDREWRENAPVIVSHSPEAVSGDDGTIYLAERVSFPKSFRQTSRDPVIEILVDGRLVYRDKAKYQGAIDHGVKWCTNGFYVDVVSK